ncbi:MAG: hypothetical protein ACYCOU_11280 [Sulfobacillus sp.]
MFVSAICDFLGQNEFQRHRRLDRALAAMTDGLRDFLFEFFSGKWNDEQSAEFRRLFDVIANTFRGSLNQFGEPDLERSGFEREFRSELEFGRLHYRYGWSFGLDTWNYYLIVELQKAGECAWIVATAGPLYDAESKAAIKKLKLRGFGTRAFEKYFEPGGTHSRRLVRKEAEQNLEGIDAQAYRMCMEAPAGELDRIAKELGMSVNGLTKHEKCIRLVAGGVRFYLEGKF